MAVDDDLMVISRDQLFGGRAAKLVPVTDVNLDTVERNSELALEIGVAGRIGIAVNGVDGRNQTKLIKNVASADVPGVNDEVNSLQRGVNARPEKAMRV